MDANENKMISKEGDVDELDYVLDCYDAFVNNCCNNIEDDELKRKVQQIVSKRNMKNSAHEVNQPQSKDDKNEIDELNSNIFGVNTTKNGNAQQNAKVGKDIENMCIDELVNYINKGEKKNENDKKKKKRKRKNDKKENEQKNENNIEIQEDKKEEDFKNEIKTENREEEKDDVFEGFKQDLLENSINRYKIHKLKLKCNPNKLYNLIKNAEEKDNDVENLNDTNKKNNNIEK